jgi:XTP/dITP diphosphohydrolase
MKKLIVATSNAGKLAEMKTYLAGYDCQLALKPPELEIEEKGTTFLENARLKSSQVALALGEWAIADDSGLAVEALQGAPGLHSARYGPNDAQRIARLLENLANNPQRQAQFICALALARPDGSIAAEAEGKCAGLILREPCGVGGFGYDPIFYVPQWQQSFAEMDRELKNKISHRGRAFAILLTRWPTELGLREKPSQ